ncbi:heavy-metal-associated domain-containing protein [Leucobacter soli]|uniref:HMA domain-containing protein n=1 Tax=Leucobacter soli TaxID=2812850 RepID=A0A916K211_9MICO|nr:heavy metal-associated domain-containing protein [Leucobacter soli]CAG7619077.1 hypothetical protein LEUCIP111803_02261 [Leucobacter soli]
MDATSKQELTVNGMTCGHCAQTLTAALGTLSGVTAVDVDVAAGRAVVQAAHPLSTEVLVGAVGEAGFELLAVYERTR